MKLIDADKLLEALKTEPQYLMEAPRSCKLLLTNIISNHHKKVIEVIEQQPTAYDVDKVVEQLENEKNNHTFWFKHSLYRDMAEIKERYEIICHELDKAIEIVRRGGTDE